MKKNIKSARFQFQILIDRCNCSRKALEGRCTPSKCFPDLYKMLYPKGGYYACSFFKPFSGKEVGNED